MARQMITCESCGKRYDYLKSEACPNCGAFNYVKGAHQHICGADDVERIIEMKSAEHDDSQEVVRPNTSIDRGLQQKYARARQKLDRLETTEDVFKSAFGGDFGTKKFSRKAKTNKSNAGCLKPLVIFIFIIVFFNLIAPLIFALISNTFESSNYEDYDVSYSEAPASEYETTYNIGVPGYTYTLNDLTFAMGGSAIVDTGDTLEPDYAVVAVKMDASCGLPSDEYATMNFTTYLTDSDYYAYYPAMDMTSYDNEELVNLLFPDSYYYFLQDFEIAYMDGQESVSGYIPYLVEKEYLDDLSYVIQFDYYDRENGSYESVCYTFPLSEGQTITTDEVIASYYNSAY